MEYHDEIRFDNAGQGHISKTIPSLPLSVKVTAWLSGLDAEFDVYLLKPKTEEWHGLRENQRFQTTIGLRMGSTEIEVKATSSVPNKSAIFHISV